MSEAPTFEIRQVEYLGQGWDDSLAVRTAVFVDEQGYDGSIEVDEQDKSCAHFVLYDAGNGKPVGNIRFQPGRQKIGRVAVLKDYRKYGLGKKLVLCVLEYAKKLAVEAGQSEVMTMCYSQASPSAMVVPFYEKLGFVQVGERFLEEGTEHQEMVRIEKLT